MLTAMTLEVPQCTNIPRPTKKDPKDTLERAFNKLAWDFLWDGGSMYIFRTHKPTIGTWLQRPNGL